MTIGGRPARSRSAARVVVVAAAVLSIAACAVPTAGTPVGTSGATDSRDPVPGGAPGGSDQQLRSQAAAYVDAVNRDDRAAAVGLTCSGRDAGALFDASSSDDDDVWTVGDVIIRGTTGFVDISVVGGSGKAIPTPFRLVGDRWCIAI